MYKRIPTKTSIFERSVGACLVLIFSAIFGAMAIAEIVCALLGVPFDSRLG